MDLIDFIIKRTLSDRGILNYFCFVSLVEGFQLLILKFDSSTLLGYNTTDPKGLSCFYFSSLSTNDKCLWKYRICFNSVVKILKSFLNILDKNHFDGMCIYYEFWQIISWLIRGLVKPQTYLVYITLFKRSMSW